MRNITKWLAILSIASVTAQNTTVSYTASDAVIANPERGLWKYSATRGSDYNPLDQATLEGYRLNDNITVIFRYFYLDTFVNSDISTSYLNKMQADFDMLRKTGLKCVLRFAYTEDESVLPHDATMQRMLDHIAQLKPILTNNADVIAAAQAGFIGTWGEWFYTSQAEFGGWGYDQTNETPYNNNNRKQIVSALLDAIPGRAIMVRKPAFKEVLYSPAALLDNEGFNGTDISRIGHHNDCFLSSGDDLGTYDNTVAEYPYLAQDTKFVPMGGETCRLNSPRSDCSTALIEMTRFHWSFLNRDYYPAVIANFQDQDCFSTIQKKLGYRFVLKNGVYPNNVVSGGNMSVTLKINNQGFAAPFNRRIAYIVFKNTVSGQVFKTPLNSDPRRWLGINDITINEVLHVPSGMPAGNYKMYLSLPDAAPTISGRPEYAIRFANDSMWEPLTGYNNLNHTVTVGSQLGVADHDILDLSIYPVPANDRVNVEMDNLDDFTLSIYNSMGQSIDAPVIREHSRISVDCAKLSEGLYFFQFVKGTTKDVRKIVVKH